MRDKTFSNKTFFIELTINFLVFALLCAVLTTAFSKTLASSRRLKEEQFAMAETEYILAQIKSGDIFFTPSENSEKSMFFCYADDWSQTSKENSSYYISLGQSVQNLEAGQLLEYTATAYRADDSEIYSAKSLAYIPKERGKADE